MHLIVPIQNSSYTMQLHINTLQWQENEQRYKLVSHQITDCDPHAWRCNKMQSFILWQMKYIMLNLLWVAYPVKVLLKQIPTDIYINLCFVLCNICIRNYSDLLNYFHTHKKRRKELKEKGMCFSQSLIYNKLSIRVKLFFSLL